VSPSTSLPPDPEAIRIEAELWLAAEPDADMADELRELLDGPPEELTARFGGRLQFGTAGLRAPIGAGPLRMNRLVVRQAAAGLATYLLDTVADVGSRGVVVGCDARRKSDLFAADTARVLAAAGIPAMVFGGVVPTPLVAWAITDLEAAAGVVVTASHNPPTDNGYKVYLGDGAQIVPPHDIGIAARIAAIDPTQIALADPDDGLISAVDTSVRERYLAEIAEVRLCPRLSRVTVAYTALHGVGATLLSEAFEAAGFDQPQMVVAQRDPDPDFSTVAFPNPEEPGAMDLVIELAGVIGADLALANDPDADRLGMAIPQPDGSWRRLSGDEIGWLFADHILKHTSGSDRLVVTTLVSSALLGRMAEAYGVHHAETFTGFKWIGRTVLDRPDQRFVFGYEQALGYLVAPRPLDKDGISAAVMAAEIAALAASEGTSLQERLDALALRFGRHITRELSVRMDPKAAAEAVARLQSHPPTQILDRHVEAVQEFREAGLLRLTLTGGVRVQVRPSGTEPKVKLYAEAVGEDPGPYMEAVVPLLSDSDT
jgi:phosphomannomutase